MQLTKEKRETEMNSKLNFKIAGLVICCVNVQNDEISQEQPYTDFLTDQEQPEDILIRYRVCAEFPEPDGCLCYADRRSRVYESCGRISRYAGNYNRINDLRGAVSCLQYSEADRQHYELLLKRENSLTMRMLFRGMGLDFLMALNRRIILHSSYIAWKGKGIVFSAPSGTGKSTQAELWRRHRPGTEIINGDRSILTCERGVPEVYGLPLCGSSGIAVNKSFPLGAVVVLRQAKTNTARRLGVREAVSLIYSECGLSLWDRDAAANVLDVVSEIAESVPVYCLSCLPHSSAVDAMERALRKDFYDV